MLLEVGKVVNLMRRQRETGFSDLMIFCLWLLTIH